MGGFDADEANKIVMECESLQEAANKLAEKGTPCPSMWEQIESWFADDPESEAWRPGKYKIVACSEHHSMELGSIVDVIEIQEAKESGLVRGRLQHGPWINIASVNASADQVWAVRISLEAQLLELGFTERQA